MAHYQQAIIGLGGNLDNPQQSVTQAIALLSELPSTKLVKASSLYASKPQGPQDQPDFINAVAMIETKLAPMALLASLQTLEKQMGKVKKRHWGERLIDLDILLFADRIIDLPQLTIPHPQIPFRDFVLLPLAEIMPDCEIPKYGKVADLIAELSESFLYPLEESNE